MSKLLKHFGLGYGNSKKSEAFDLRAKTLPAPATGRCTVGVFTDTFKSSGRRNIGNISHTECDDCDNRNVTLPSRSSCHSAHETFLTIPFQELSVRRQLDWSSRGTNSREHMQPAVTLFGHRNSSLTGYKKRCNSDTKDLRRSVTADEISRNECNTPAVCISQCYIFLQMLFSIHPDGHL